MKKIRISLFGSKGNSIDDAIKEIEAYRKEIRKKTEEFMRRLADIGVSEAIQVLAFEGMGDAPRDADFAVEVDPQGNIVHVMIRGKGEGLLFWEFGAGNFYNGMTSPNPKAGEFGMGPGTYPGQTHVPHPGFWYYYDGDKAVRSVGTQATMPMYKASLEMIQRVYEIAREVYG